MKQELRRLRGEVEKWRQIAVQLERALRSTPYYECGELDHSGGHYHSGTEPCPIEAKNRAALEAFAAAMEVQP